MLDKTAAPKFYASAKADGEVSLKALAKEIAQGSTTVSDTDVLAVLNDLTKVLIRHLSEGKIVKLGDFGNFQITLTSEALPPPRSLPLRSSRATKFSSAQVPTSARCSKPLSTKNTRSSTPYHTDIYA